MRKKSQDQGEEALQGYHAAAAALREAAKIVNGAAAVFERLGANFESSERWAASLAADLSGDREAFRLSFAKTALEKGRLINASEVAAMLGMTSGGVLYHVRTGKLAAAQKRHGAGNKGVYLFDPAIVKEFRDQIKAQKLARGAALRPKRTLPKARGARKARKETKSENKSEVVA